MSRDTFTWKPLLGSELSEEPNVTTLRFGDGYEARVPSGLNNQLKKWSLVFEEPLIEHNKIKAFLRKQGGVKSFIWTSPDGLTDIYICRSWKSKQRGFGVYEVSCVFEQVFEI